MSEVKKTIRVVMIGDVVGTPGMAMCHKWVPKLRQLHNLDGIIINAENAGKSGRGLNAEICEALFTSGADVITTGNHVWNHDKFIPYLIESQAVVRPINYPEECPGKGFVFAEIAGVKVAVLNVMGRAFFQRTFKLSFSTCFSCG